MRILLIPIFIVSLLSSDTYIHNSVITNSMIGNNIYSGSEKSSLISKNIILKEKFTKIQVNFPIQLSVKKSYKNDVILKIDKNFKDNISFKVYNDTLHINALGSINTRLKTEVVINTVSLNELDLKSTVRANIKGFNSNRFKLFTSGTSRVNFSEGSIKNLFLDAKGTSKIYLEKIPIGNATITAKGTSKITINVSDYLNVTLSGVSKVKYLGNPKITKRLKSLGKLIKIK